MKITTELLQQILEPKDDSWVKVKAYEQKPGDGVGPFQEDYWNLLAHHIEETEFLFDVIHALAEQLNEYYNPRSDQPTPGGGKL